MSKEARAKPKAVSPRDSASLIIVDHSGRHPKVLMGKRHHAHKFMPNKYVFPGGRVDPSDRKVNIAGPLDPIVEERVLRLVQRPSSMKARAFALAAIRETFEETGLLIGEKDLGAPPEIIGTPWAQFTAREIWPALDRLHFIARAITPPASPKRFDTRFFLIDADAIADKVDNVVGPDAELTELHWVPLGDTGDLEIASITHMILDEVRIRLEGRLSPFLPVPFFHEVRGQYRRDEI